MARIIAGLFEDQVAAGRAIERMRAEGAGHDDITTFIVNPPGMHHGLALGGDQPADAESKRGDEGAVRGAAIGGAAGIAAGLAMTPLVGPIAIAGGVSAGAFVGALAGAGSAMGNESKDYPTARPGGVMVAINADHFDQRIAADVMRACDAKLVEAADGQWRDGVWVDFDPVGPPTEVLHTAGNPNYPTDTTRAGAEQPRPAK
jgi:hypothetical protein